MQIISEIQFYQTFSLIKRKLFCFQCLCYKFYNYQCLCYKHINLTSKIEKKQRLVRLTPCVNFTNILRAAFAPIFFHQKSTNLKYRYKKLCAKLLNEKATCKMLVKINTGLNFINFQLVAFVPVGLHQTYWGSAQGVQGRSIEYFLVVCIGKFGRNIVNETEWRRRITAGTKE